MPISQMILPEFDHEMANTRKTLERVPDDKFAWKPHEKSMTLGDENWRAKWSLLSRATQSSPCPGPQSYTVSS